MTTNIRNASRALIALVAAFVAVPSLALAASSATPAADVGVTKAKVTKHHHRHHHVAKASAKVSSARTASPAK